MLRVVPYGQRLAAVGQTGCWAGRVAQSRQRGKMILVTGAGGFIGRALFHAVGIRSLGFGLFGIELIPAFVGAVLVVVAAELFTSRRSLA